MSRNQSEVAELYSISLAADKKNKKICNTCKLLLALSTKLFQSIYRQITTTQKSHAFTNLRI